MHRALHPTSPRSLFPRCTAALGLSLLLGIPTRVAAQTPEWIPTFPSLPLPGFNDRVNAMVQFDDGSGEALYVGGEFTQCAGQPASLVARYDGSAWDNLNGGIPFPPFVDDAFVADLAVFDAGNGPELYAAGYNGFTNNLARWDGLAWTMLPWAPGAAPSVIHFAFEVYDLADGLGERLFLAGYDGVATLPVLAVLDNGQLTPVAGFPWVLGPLGSQAIVTDLIGFDDGSGPALYLAGDFDLAESQGGGVARNVARYRAGGQITALDPGYWPPALEFLEVRLAVQPFAGTPRLVAAWSLPYGTVSGLPAALTVFDGTDWQDLGQLNDTFVGSLLSFDAEDGLGPCLVISGNFTTIAGLPVGGLARLHGSNWLPMVPQGNWIPSSGLAAYRPEPGAPPSLLIGSPTLVPGYQPNAYLTRWQAGEVLPIHTPPAALNGGVRALCSYDGGNGLELYAGGGFSQAGGVQVDGLARWNGSNWSAVGSGHSGPVRALAVHDQGQGPWLYIGGSFNSPASNNLVAWDGTAFIACSPSLNGPVEDLLSVPKTAFTPAAPTDQLYVAGSFTGVPGSAGQVRRVARWDGTWTGFSTGGGGGGGGGGMQAGPNDTVHALALFESQGVPHIYFGGSFTQITNQPLAGLGRFAPTLTPFTGSTNFNAGVTGQVFALEVFDGGAGPRLYAGGILTAAGGQPVQGLASYTGQAWVSVPPLFALGTPRIEDLHVHDDGSGEALIATGEFSNAFGLPLANLGSFDGQGWSALPSGLVGSGLALGSHPHPKTLGPALFVGCNQPGQPDSGDAYLAAYGLKAAQGVPFTASSGCLAKQGILTPSSGPLAVGQLESLQLASPAAAGVALLYVGVPIGLPGGCGLDVPGIGELLLALSPKPASLTSAATTAGVSQFALPVPAVSNLVGKSLLFQAAQVDLSQPAPTIELSSALTVVIQP